MLWISQACRVCLLITYFCCSLYKLCCLSVCFREADSCWDETWAVCYLPLGFLTCQIVVDTRHKVNPVPAEMSRHTTQYHLHVPIPQSVRPMFADCEVPVHILFIFLRQVLRSTTTCSCGSWVRCKTTPQSTVHTYVMQSYWLHIKTSVSICTYYTLSWKCEICTISLDILPCTFFMEKLPPPRKIFPKTSKSHRIFPVHFLCDMLGRQSQV